MTTSLTHSEFQNGLNRLINHGLVLPHSLFPGAFPGGNHGFTTQAEWDAYQWNPPQHLALGQFYSFGWDFEGETTRKQTRANFQMAYLAQDERPIIDYDAVSGKDSRLNEDFTPAGWTRTYPIDATTSVWYMNRDINHITADQALTTPDPDASPKPTWVQIGAAAFQDKIDLINEELIEGHNPLFESSLEGFPAMLWRRCQYQITATAFGAKTREHEYHIREHLQTSGKPTDAAKLETMHCHKDHLRGRYHEIKAWATNLLATPTEAAVAKLEALRTMLEGGTDDSLWVAARWVPPMETAFFDSYHLVPDYTHTSPQSAPPPAYMNLSLKERNGLVLTFEALTTAAATISIAVDNQDVALSVNQIVAPRAGKYEFTGTAKKPNIDFIVTMMGSPYGLSIQASLSLSA